MLSSINYVHAQDDSVFKDLRNLAPEGTFAQLDETPSFGELSYKSRDISINIEKQRVNKTGTAGDHQSPAFFY